MSLSVIIADRKINPFTKNSTYLRYTCRLLTGFNGIKYHGYKIPSEFQLYNAFSCVGDNF